MTNNDRHKLEIIRVKDGTMPRVLLDGFELKCVRGLAVDRCWTEDADCLVLALQVQPTQVEPAHVCSGTALVI